MEEQSKMIKLGIYDDLNKNLKHAFDSTDLAKQLTNEENKKEKEKDKD